VNAGQPDAASLELTFSLVTEVDAPPDIAEDELAALARSVLEAEGAVGHWDVTVALVGDDRLQALHRDFMGIDTPTDIMTFPADDADGGRRGGELAISVDHARTQADAWGLSPADEIRFLVVHGLLHLLGWRDESDEERVPMLARQQVLFDRSRGAD
jgi:probable rRNA maturation factor